MTLHGLMVKLVTKLSLEPVSPHVGATSSQLHYWLWWLANMPLGPTMPRGVDSEGRKSCLIQLHVPLPSMDIAIEGKDCRGGLDRSGVIKDRNEEKLVTLDKSPPLS